MPLPIPTLDDRTYADLVSEAVAQIPSLAPEWTDHNASDPGITLLELLAWRVEMLLYRADQVPPAHVRAFLRLLNGPAWTPSAERTLDEEVTATVLALRQRVRAVTGADYEALSVGEFGGLRLRMAGCEEEWRAFRAGGGAAAADPLAEWWRSTGMEAGDAGLPTALPSVARAVCFPRRDLTLPGSGEVAGHVSVVVVADGPHPPPPEVEERLCGAVWSFLDERRLVATWHHVVAPVRVPVRVRVVAALRSDIPETPARPPAPGDEAAARDGLARTVGTLVERHRIAQAQATSEEARRAAQEMLDGFRELQDALWAHLPSDPRAAVVEKIARFLDPVRGNHDGKGWPLGRSVYLSDLYALVEDLPFVEYVPLVLLESGCDDDTCVRAPVTYNDDGQVIGLRLSGHQLPLLRMDAADVSLSGSLVAVVVRARLARPRSAYTGAELGGLRAASRQAFPPLMPPAGLLPGGVVEVRLDDVRAEMARLSGLAPAEIVSLEVLAEPSRLGRDRTGAVTSVRFRDGEMAEVSVDLSGTEPPPSTPEKEEKPS